MHDPKPEIRQRVKYTCEDGLADAKHDIINSDFSVYGQLEVCVGDDSDDEGKLDANDESFHADNIPKM